LDKIKLKGGLKIRVDKLWGDKGRDRGVTRVNKGWGAHEGGSYGKGGAMGGGKR